MQKKKTKSKRRVLSMLSVPGGLDTAKPLSRKQNRLRSLGGAVAVTAVAAPVRSCLSARFRAFTPCVRNLSNTPSTRPKAAHLVGYPAADVVLVLPPLALAFWRRADIKTRRRERLVLWRSAGRQQHAKRGL